MSDLTDLAAKRRALADSIILDNPRTREAHNVFEFLIEHGKLRATGAKRAVLLVGPSQSGKTTIIDTYARQRNTDEARRKRHVPVLVVTLEANVTRKGLAINILEALEDHGFQTGATSGNELTLLRRVRAYLAAAQVELLILDEIHHLVHSESQRLAKSVSETIKRMLIKGVCPIVMAGIEDARRLTQANSQLAQRCHPSIDLNPLRHNPADLKLFGTFLRGYYTRLEEVGAIGHHAELASVETLCCILEVSRGVLGAACNLIKEAIYVATLAGRDILMQADLSDVTDRSFVAHGLHHRNPFVHGLQHSKLVRA